MEQHPAHCFRQGNIIFKLSGLGMSKALYLRPVILQGLELAQSLPENENYILHNIPLITQL